MTNNFDACLAHVLKSEGGFVNHPADPGGMTNLGVTKRVWEEYTKRQASEMEMRSLTPDMVKPLYRDMYWDRVKADDLPVGVDLCVFDLAVNSGVYRAAVTLQRVLGAQDDGIIGPKTLAAAGSADPEQLIKDYCKRRRMFIRGLATYVTFGKGWENRINKVETDSFAMLLQP